LTTIASSPFLANMRALWRRDPQLAVRVDAVDDEQRYPLETTRSGHHTVRVAGEGGRELYLHSRYDPVAEAVKLAAAVPIEGKFCFVVYGFALGYHVRAMLDRLVGDGVVIVIEPDLRTLATGLVCCDVSAAIDAGRLIFLVDEDKARLHDLLRAHNALIMLGAEFLRHPPSMQLHPQAIGGISRLLTEFFSFTRMSLLTLVGNARTTCRNIAMNLPTYVSTPPIDILRDRFAGNPAVIVSAGPSLRRNIDRLAAAKGRAVICAVQTTLRPLLSRGITPDFVTSLDFHEMSRKFFEDVGDLSDVHLVAEPKATWRVIDGYPGPVSLLGNDWAELVLGERLGRRAGLKAGATVAHLAFYLAVYMGCNPIIFVGQDLAFTGHVFYIPGVEIHQTWRSELNRFSTIEMKEWDRIARNGEILRKVEDIHGAPIYTDDLLFTYLEQFEKDIALAPATVINATEGGARIRGTQAMTLDEALARHAPSPIDPRRFAYRREHRWNDASRRAEAAAVINRRRQELTEVAALCDEMIGLLNELKTLTHDPARFNRRLIRVDELRAKVSQDSRAYRIVNMAAQLAEMKRYSADRRISAVQADEVEIAKRQLDRDVDFVTAVRDGARDVDGMLEEALRRFDASAAESREVTT
jgi:hypothetical protein